jgi:hypothetical protein
MTPFDQKGEEFYLAIIASERMFGQVHQPLSWLANLLGRNQAARLSIKSQSTFFLA